MINDIIHDVVYSLVYVIPISIITLAIYLPVWYFLNRKTKTEKQTNERYHKNQERIADSLEKIAAAFEKKN